MQAKRLIISWCLTALSMSSAFQVFALGDRGMAGAQQPLGQQSELELVRQAVLALGSAVRELRPVPQDAYNIVVDIERLFFATKDPKKLVPLVSQLVAVIDLPEAKKLQKLIAPRPAHYAAKPLSDTKLKTKTMGGKECTVYAENGKLSVRDKPAPADHNHLFVVLLEPLPGCLLSKGLLYGPHWPRFVLIPAE